MCEIISVMGKNNKSKIDKSFCPKSLRSASAQQLAYERDLNARKQGDGIK